jgi:hypothetical protein
LASAITSKAGARSLAMALRTQNCIWHYLLPPVSPHEDNVRDAGRNIHNSLDEGAGLRGRLGDIDGVRIGRLVQTPCL